MIQLRLFFLLFTGFVLSTIVGTLSHEGGHWAVAEVLGQDARIAYGYTDFVGPYVEWSPAKRLAVTLGGPLQTMLTGTVGLILLHRNRHRYHSAVLLSFSRWTLIFLTLFWLREPTNGIVWVGKGLLTGDWETRMDEVKLAYWLNLPAFSIIATAGIVGSVVLAYLVFRVVPAAQRLTFLAAGLFGGVFGYLFWLEWIGPLVLP